MIFDCLGVEFWTELVHHQLLPLASPAETRSCRPCLSFIINPLFTFHHAIFTFISTIVPLLLFQYVPYAILNPLITIYITPFWICLLEARLGPGDVDHRHYYCISRYPVEYNTKHTAVDDLPDSY